MESRTLIVNVLRAAGGWLLFAGLTYVAILAYSGKPIDLAAADRFITGVSVIGMVVVLLIGPFWLLSSDNPLPRNHRAIGLGLILGCWLYVHPDFTLRALGFAGIVAILVCLTEWAKDGSLPAFRRPSGTDPQE